MDVSFIWDSSSKEKQKSQRQDPKKKEIRNVGTLKKKTEHFHQSGIQTPLSKMTPSYGLVSTSGPHIHYCDCGCHVIYTSKILTISTYRKILCRAHRFRCTSTSIGESTSDHHLVPPTVLSFFWFFLIANEVMKK